MLRVVLADVPPQHFLFGTSQNMRLSAIKKLIHDQLTRPASTGPLFLVFHDYSQDIKCVWRMTLAPFSLSC